MAAINQPTRTCDINNRLIVKAIDMRRANEAADMTRSVNQKGEVFKVNRGSRRVAAGCPRLTRAGAGCRGLARVGAGCGSRCRFH